MISDAYKLDLDFSLVSTLGDTLADNLTSILRCNSNVAIRWNHSGIFRVGNHRVFYLDFDWPIMLIADITLFEIGSSVYELSKVLTCLVRPKACGFQPKLLDGGKATRSA